ncbi:hypothetical protein ACVGWS_00935, partial [Enterobacter hormaechei]
PPPPPPSFFTTRRGNTTWFCESGGVVFVYNRLTYLLVSHYGEVIANMSDRAAFMAQGVIQGLFDGEELLGGEHSMG